MRKLVIHRQIAERLNPAERRATLELCPFKALEESGGGFSINAACKMCNICVKNGPPGLFTLQEVEEQPSLDKSQWQGIAVYIEHHRGALHPVSLELLGKARQLAAPLGFPVYALLIGHNLQNPAQELLHYGVDEVFLYDYPQLENFLVEPYTNACADFSLTVRPAVILLGATSVGRSLAPRLAARLRTGLTADCTRLEIKENSDLVQIRPAFGGNIMAQIVTPNHRPQLATVRYKIFDAPTRQDKPTGRITTCSLQLQQLESRVQVLESIAREQTKTISEAEIIVAVGRGLKAEKDLAPARQLAGLLGAEMAATRPVVEAGWLPAPCQIGLSGRAVKPKLIITLGVSGAVQFKAGMENAELILALNTDEKANIFSVCHYAVCGDIYDIVPRLINKIREGGQAHV